MSVNVTFPTLEVESDPFADAPTRTLSETIQPFADAYDERIGDRDRTTWRWFDRVESEFRLSCLDEAHAQRARDAKVLATMFITVVDDVAERHGDRKTLEELLTVPFESRPAEPTRDGVDGEYVRFQQELWDGLLALYDQSPRAPAFEDLLRFDVRQALQSVDYSSLIADRPGLAGERELWTYDAHNMMIFVFADIDLANSPAFDAGELAAIRTVVDRTQRMARIGNWIGTWERELAEGDYSSGVVVRALESGLVSETELRAIHQSPTESTVEPVVDRIRDSEIEAAFVDRWCQEYDAAVAYADDVDSVDVCDYVESFEPIFRSQLARRPSD
ncbi:hypothetical protein [Natronolimnohabitans innermongolicus]|uniref:Uncharacterized protein n=1 Tax=Natronolimnohabitans innermongolicus JCM 12255 TaxID=1227499 RepID=L9WQF6_9EURY|nr:hypothetical protein [Natronolimnohabitans innermongolicus]ELY51719.1 hypothetical protein C493_17356 [Natronolimnohabitans innermongolicus JCM 12255]